MFFFFCFRGLYISYIMAEHGWQRLTRCFNISSTSQHGHVKGAFTPAIAWVRLSSIRSSVINRSGWTNAPFEITHMVVVDLVWIHHSNKTLHQIGSPADSQLNYQLLLGLEHIYNWFHWSVHPSPLDSQFHAGEAALQLVQNLGRAETVMAMHKQTRHNKWCV